ncbi:DUF6056 family protein [Lapidilactobacillus bayanensis]|uniref:DUF6056 family protein n=1 Tax=Lapidilactobacillus bayanensis TaxID=2485998 RepID=UPI000F7BB19D|nr:DUF6056 family protein [Lapidilactobacillus bayanensis]
MLKKLINKSNIILLCVLFSLFYMVPYNHDEWAWGTQEGIANLKNFFQGYNGRYFGDLISLAITRSVLFKAAFMAISTFSLYLLMRLQISYGKHHSARLKVEGQLTLLLMLLVPTMLFQQIYGWPAAFVNFVPPVIFLIGYLYIIRRSILSEDAPKHALLLTMICTIGTQFFSENISIYMLLLTISVAIIDVFKNKKISKVSIYSVVFSLLGTIIMFINPAYTNAANGSDGYKKIEFTFSFLWTKLGTQIIPNMVLNYKVLLLIFGIVLVMLAYFNGNNNSSNLLNSIMLFVLIGYTIYGVFFYPNLQFPARFSATIINLSSFCYFIALVHIVNSISTASSRLLYLILTISVPVSAGPLLMADPIGPRSFYLTYIIWLLLIILLVDNLMDYFNISEHAYYALYHLFSSAIVVVFLCYYLIFGYIYHVNQQRTQLIDQAIKDEKSSLVLPYLPNDKYIWKTSTEPNNWLVRFKKFYGIPKHIDVTFK